MQLDGQQMVFLRAFQQAQSLAVFPMLLIVPKDKNKLKKEVARKLVICLSSHSALTSHRRPRDFWDERMKLMPKFAP
jgi:hypothetical protein